MKKVVIIGAGPAGMIAGIIAKKNGNDVCIIERDSSDDDSWNFHLESKKQQSDHWQSRKSAGNFGRAL